MPQLKPIGSPSVVPIYVAFALILLPLAMIGPDRAFALTLPSAAAWCVIGYSVIRLTIKGVQGNNAPISMTFWIFVYIFFGVAALIQLVNGLSDEYSESTLVGAFAVVLLGCVAFDFGASVIGPRQSKGFLNKTIFRASELSRGRAIVLGIGALVATPFLVEAYGGLDKLFLSRNERFQALVRAAGDSDSQVLTQTILALINTPIFVAFMALLALYVHQRKSADPYVKRVSLVTVLVVGTAALIINNPVSSPRWTVGVSVLSILFYVAPWSRRQTFSLTVLGVALLFVLAFPFADAFRATSDPDIAAHLRETSVETEIAEAGSYDAFEQLVNVLRYVDQNGLGYGRQLAGTALFWFPRSAWANKPIPSGPLVAEWRGTSNTNLSLPLWGEFYLDGHVALVAVGMLLYGALAGGIEQQYIASNRETPNFATLFVPIFGAYQIFLLRGSLLGTIAQLVPFVLCMWFCTKRTSSDRAFVPPVETGPPTTYVIARR
jgi:hypothetical protein